MVMVMGYTLWGLESFGASGSLVGREGPEVFGAPAFLLQVAYHPMQQIHAVWVLEESWRGWFLAESLDHSLFYFYHQT